MTKEATTTPKKKRTTRKSTKSTKPKEENKAAMDNTPQPITPNEDPSHNNKVKEEEDKPKNNTKEFNLNDYPRYTQTRYNVLLDRYMRQNHLFAEAHNLALRDLKLQKLI